MTDKLLHIKTSISMFQRLFIVLILTALSCSTFADPASDIERLRAKLLEGFPAYSPDSITAAPMAGWYQALYGTQVIYISVDGRYLIQGVVMDINDGKRNLTALATKQARQSYMQEVKAQTALRFGAKNPQHTVTIFTDIDCTYCRKLHSQVDSYASYGIAINYLMFPRKGMGSEGYKKAVSVWCSADREKALTEAKLGKDVEAKDCPNPIADHYALGQKVGVSGTPAILLEDGTLIPGFVPAAELAKQLGTTR